MKKHTESEENFVALEVFNHLLVHHSLQNLRQAW